MCCLLIVSKVIVKFGYWELLGKKNRVMQTMCFTSPNKQLFC